MPGRGSSPSPRSSRSRSSTSRASRSGVRLLNGVSFLKIALIGGLMVGALMSAAGSWSHFVPFVARPAGAPALGRRHRRGVRRGVLLVRRVVGSDAHRAAKCGIRRGRCRARCCSVSSIVTLVYTSVDAGVHVSRPDRSGRRGAGVRRPGRRRDHRTPRRRRWWPRSSSSACWAAWRAIQMIAPRTYFAMAQDGVFPAAAAALHPRFGTPARAIAIQAVLASCHGRPRHLRHDRRLFRVHHRGLHRRHGGVGVRACGGGMPDFWCRAIRGRLRHFSPWRLYCSVC